MEGGKNWMAPGDPLQDCRRLRATLGPEHVEEHLTGRALGQLRPADAAGPPSLPPHAVFEALIIQALLAVRRGPGGPSQAKRAGREGPRAVPTDTSRPPVGKGPDGARSKTIADGPDRVLENTRGQPRRRLPPSGPPGEE